MYTTMVKETMGNMEQMDMIVLPTALAMLAFLLGSCRLLIVPIMCLLVTASLAFASVDGVTHVMDIMTAAPSLMMSIFLAVSIDYSLFLLSRFKVEVKGSTATDRASPNAMQEIVATVLRTSGKVVLASGTTLAVCFLGVLFLPLDLIQSIGVGCSISLM